MKTKEKSTFSGAILAAGRGVRVAPLSLKFPKPLLPIANKPIIEHQIIFMKENGITEIFIVVGYMKHKIIEYFGDGRKWGVTIRYIEQEQQLGIAHAVSKLEPYIKQPFLLCLGDIFFSKPKISEFLTKFLSFGGKGGIGVVNEDDLLAVKKNFAVYLAGDGQTIKWVIEKPHYPNTNLKGCGIYLFDQVVFDAIRSTPCTSMRNEYEITSSIQILIDLGSKLFAQDITDWDYNVTTPEDLYRCNLMWLASQKIPNMIESTVIADEDCFFENTIIGQNVRLIGVKKVINSVILADSLISSQEVILNQLVTPTETFTFE